MSPALTSASEVGIANLPNQRHKIVSKKGTNFTLMVVGESGLGKTTFLSTLFTTTIKDYKDNDKRHEKQLAKTVDIELTKAELEERLFSVNLTVVDTPGFGDYVNNRDNWVPIVEYIDDQYENYMRQELQPKRKDVADQRVHACLYFIRPTGHTLKPLDIEAMKHLSERVNLIPVIGKADTLTPRDLESFKKRIRGVIESQGIRVYQCPAESDDESSTKRNVDIMSAMPFAVVGSDQDVVNAAGQTVKGRQYPWGVVEVENEAHCDFKKLRNLLIRTHMLDLITTTRELHYERYRHTQLELRGGDALPKLAGGPGRKPADSRFKEEEENLRRRFTEQVKAEEARFKAWEQKLIGERDRLNKDLESEHNYVRLLQDEVEAMAVSLKK